MAMKARVVSKGLQKITMPIANSQSALLVLNQLKTNMTNNFVERKMTPYVTPGGMTLAYSYSLRIWLAGSKAKASFLEDERGFRVGSQVKATIKKSRFGSEGRKCEFKILWAGGEVGVQDEESWLDAIKSSPKIVVGGAWYTLIGEGGEERKFQRKNWREELKDPDFKKAILDIIDEEVIVKFDERGGDASQYYDNDEKGEEL
jgi:RecA/RadA recombinase